MVGVACVFCVSRGATVANVTVGLRRTRSSKRAGETWRNESRNTNVAQWAANKRPEDTNGTGMDSEREERRDRRQK